MAVKIQALRQSFENLHRKENEGVQAYIAKVNDIVNQMRGLGDKIPDPLVVGKVLRSLGPRYNFLVDAIGEAKDLTQLTMDELAGSLQAHEALMFSQDDKSSEKAFAVKPEATKLKKDGKFPVREDSQATRGRGRGAWRGRGFNRGRGRSSGPRQRSWRDKIIKESYSALIAKNMAIINQSVGLKINLHVWQKNKG